MASEIRNFFLAQDCHIPRVESLLHDSVSYNYLDSTFIF